MKRIYTLLASLAILSLPACTPTTKGPADAAQPTASSLDWPGTYRGLLPCADCNGIETIMELNPDQTYMLKTRYEGKESPIVESQGSFRWNEAGTTLILENEEAADRPTYYQLGEHQLRQLDRQGQRIQGELADRYMLHKLDLALLDRRWQLVALNDRALSPDTTRRQEPYLWLQLEGSRLQGHGGCNSLAGSYQLQPGNRLRFSQVVSTRMACPNMEPELQLQQVLEQTDGYRIEEARLLLLQGQKTLAAFEAAEGK